MPKINTYPTVTPSTSDLLLISDTSATDNPTKTCTVNDIVALGTSNIVFNAKISLSTAQIATLNSSPVTVIAAPGAGKFIQVNSIAVTLNYPVGSAQITGADSLEFMLSPHNGGDEPIFGDSGFLDKTSTTRFMMASNASKVDDNHALIVSNADSITSDPTMNGSTSTLDIYVNYSVITI